MLPREIFGKSTFELAVMLLKWLPLWFVDKLCGGIALQMFSMISKSAFSDKCMGDFSF